MQSKIDKKIGSEKWIFNKLKELYSNEKFDDLVGYIGSFSEWSIFKRKPERNGRKATNIYIKHDNDEIHLGFQFLLTGILSVFYDKTRNTIDRPGFTGFPSGRQRTSILGSINSLKLR